MLLTERELYRTTDVIDVWGYLRGRDDDSVPPSVRLRLVRSDAESLDDPPAVARADVAPDAAGTFSASLRLSRVPIGYYRLQAVVDGRVVASAYVEVGVIRKPAYRLDLEPDRRAVFSGTTVHFTTTATFFDGSPVPDLPITYGANGTATTDATGRDVVSVEMNADECTDEYCRWDTGGQDEGLGVSPAVQEEAEIGASADVVVFPTSHDIDLEGRLDGRTLRISGSVDEVDLAKVEAAIAAGTWDRWDEATNDPDGAPVPGANVKVTVTELVPVRRQVGSDYDFIEKVVRPRYEYDTRRELVRTLTVRTDSRGRLAANVAVPDAGHQYEIDRRDRRPAGPGGAAPDLGGRPVRRLVGCSPACSSRPPTARAPAKRSTGSASAVAWRITDDGEPVEPAPTDRFLYIVAQRGLRSAAVTTSPTFERTFAAADAPAHLRHGHPVHRHRPTPPRPRPGPTSTRRSASWTSR